MQDFCGQGIFRDSYNLHHLIKSELGENIQNNYFVFFFIEQPRPTAVPSGRLFCKVPNIKF